MTPSTSHECDTRRFACQTRLDGPLERLILSRWTHKLPRLSRWACEKAASDTRALFSHVLSIACDGIGSLERTPGHVLLAPAFTCRFTQTAVLSAQFCTLWRFLPRWAPSDGNNRRFATNRPARTAVCNIWQQYAATAHSHPQIYGSNSLYHRTRS